MRRRPDAHHNRQYLSQSSPSENAKSGCAGRQPVRRQRRGVASASKNGSASNAGMTAFECVAGSGGLASHVRMTDATRFQFRLPAAQRAQLETLAVQSGLSSADLTRLALQRLL